MAAYRIWQVNGMVIDWTVLTYVIVAIFVLVGFSSGWWKEAIVAFFLGVLVFLLQNPDVAESLINGINQVFATIWGYLPASLKELVGGPIKLNAASANTWLLILIVGMVIFTQIGRLGLPGSYYAGPLSRVLGAVLGGVNGLIIANLVREYLDGRSLPGSSTAAATASAEITLAGTSSAGPPASEVGVAFTNLPSVTLLDSAAPWIIFGLALMLVIGAVANSFRVQSNTENMKKITRQKPFGYG